MSEHIQVLCVKMRYTNRRILYFTLLYRRASLVDLYLHAKFH